MWIFLASAEDYRKSFTEEIWLWDRVRNAGGQMAAPDGLGFEGCEKMPRFDEGGTALATAALVGIEDAILVVTGEAGGPDKIFMDEALRLAAFYNRRVIYGRTALKYEWENFIEQYLDSDSEDDHDSNVDAMDKHHHNPKVADKRKFHLKVKRRKHAK